MFVVCVVCVVNVGLVCCVWVGCAFVWCACVCSVFVCGGGVCGVCVLFVCGVCVWFVCVGVLVFVCVASLWRGECLCGVCVCVCSHEVSFLRRSAFNVSGQLK